METNSILIKTNQYAMLECLSDGLRSKGTFKNEKKMKILKTMFWGFYYSGKY